MRMGAEFDPFSRTVDDQGRGAKIKIIALVAQDDVEMNAPPVEPLEGGSHIDIMH